MNATMFPHVGQFNVDVEPHRDVVWVRPKGEVDLATVGKVREGVDELLSAGFTRLLLDLREVTFLDSNGLRLILELTRASSDDGWQFGLIEGPPDVQRVFEVTGLRPQLPFVSGREQAWR